MYERRQRGARRWLAAFVLAAILDALVAVGLSRVMPLMGTPVSAPTPLSLVLLQPPPTPDDADESLEEPEAPDGQLVETAEPDEERRPEEADYVAEHDNAVDEQTRIDEYRVNPDVLSDVFSEEDTYEQEDLVDLNVAEPSTGATVGNERFEPDRDGRLASLPSAWTLTNREGLERPVPSAHRFAALAGAPQNDLVEEELGDRIALNTKEYLYAGYLAQIRRMVNSRWVDNLDTLRTHVRFTRSRYTTVVRVVLDEHGVIRDLEVEESATIRELDDAVTRAYTMAGPFPPPPEGLLGPDGLCHLPRMSWVAKNAAHQARFSGVDPRAGVLYPGIHKSPR